MKDSLKAGFAERLKAAAASKQALLGKLRPKPTQTNPDHEARAGLRAAELAGVRERRAKSKDDKRQASEEALVAAQRAAAEAQEAEVQAKRGKRKDRKALSAAEAKAARDAKYAARQARR